jgi:Tfp pilus assembly protein PilO
MMISKQWDKNTVIKVGAALGVVVVLCIWSVTSINKAAAAQQVRLDAARQELSTLQNDAGQLSAMQAEFRRMQEALAHLEPGVPEDRKSTYLPTLLKQIQKLADDTKVKLRQVNPGSVKAKTNVPPPAAPSAKDKDASGSAPAAPAKPAAPAEEKVGVSLQLEGTFAQLMTFLEGLKSFPKVIEVESVQLQPDSSKDDAVGASPNLRITMEATATVLPLMSGGGS